MAAAVTAVGAAGAGGAGSGPKPAARVDDRVGSHGGPPSMGGLVRSLLVGAAVGGPAGLIAAAVGAGVARLRASGCSRIKAGSPEVQIENKRVARAGVDENDHGRVRLREGSAKVYVNGRPLVRVGDASTCGGVVTSGARRTLIGGPSTSGGSSGALSPTLATATGLVRLAQLGARFGTDTASDADPSPFTGAAPARGAGAGALVGSCSPRDEEAPGANDRGVPARALLPQGNFRPPMPATPPRTLDDAITFARGQGPGQVVFRGADRPPPLGFRGWAPSGDFYEGESLRAAVERHINHPGRTPFTSTSTHPGVAADFAARRTQFGTATESWVYVVHSPRGIDAATTLGPERYSALLRNMQVEPEYEVLMLRGIRPDEIVGAQRMVNGQPVGPFVMNPDYRPPAMRPQRRADAVDHSQPGHSCAACSGRPPSARAVSDRAGETLRPGSVPDDVDQVRRQARPASNDMRYGIGRGGIYEYDANGEFRRVITQAEDRRALPSDVGRRLMTQAMARRGAMMEYHNNFFGWLDTPEAERFFGLEPRARSPGR